MRINSKRIIIKSLILIVALLCQTLNGKGQGCSDAGFCTMGAMRPDQLYNKKINFKLRSVELSQYVGQTTLSPKVYVTNLDFTFSINNKNSFQVKIPYQAVSGNLGETAGLADISLSATRQLHSSEKFDVNFTIGTKIPTNNSDLKKKDDQFSNAGSQYPMYYQISLGSYDAIAGLSIISKKWLLAVGYQNALTANKNAFSLSEWGNYPSQSYLKGHNESFELKRGTDVMMRVERNWRFSNYNFSFGMLPIYRITKDQIKPQDEYISVDKTTGLALTALFSAGYHFNINSGLKLILGLKLEDREANPDELTRDNVITLAYTYRF